MPSQHIHTALLLVPEPPLRRALRQNLLAEGVQRVLEGSTGAEGLTRLGTELVQLVLTPWELPDMAGRTLLHSLRNHGRNREVPVVLLDAGLPTANVVAAVKAGAAGRLSLPAPRQAVRELLRRIVAGNTLVVGTAVGAPGDPVGRRRARPRS